MDAEILAKLGDIEILISSFTWFLEIYCLFFGCICGFLGFFIVFQSMKYKKLL